MTDFSPGDVVSLKSGSPRMTLNVIEDGIATVGYFAYVKDEGGPYVEIKIPVTSLEKAPKK